MTTEEIPFDEVRTRKIADIQTRRSNLVACNGVFVVTENCRRHSRSAH